jgi:predicted nuclease of predicted toxin-antitoxin system
MKFLLDEDTNAKICTRLREAGHRAEIAQRAGYSRTRDEYVAEFADEIGAVFLSHDVAFHRDRQKVGTRGYHVLLIGPNERRQCG